MPEALSGRARYRRILRFAAWNLIVTWWYELALPVIGLRAVADRTRIARMQRFASRFRALAVELGGLMIKLGQFMSTRLDVLPPEVTRELEGLQDEVPPAPFDQVQRLAEEQLGVPLAQVYAEFDHEPVASASLGQAYRARLAQLDAEQAGFDKVIVKIQRPGIGEIVGVDLSALRRIARWVAKFRIVSRRVDLPGLVEEFAKSSFEEIDYIHEAGNAERFQQNFRDDPRVRVPAVVWERSTRHVLTLEDVTAIKISDTHALREAGIDPARVAKVFAELMFDQLFVHGFFHADPHPGNLFITPAPDGGAGSGGDGAGSAGAPDWKLTFIDFGMMGSVPPQLRGSLRKLVIAGATRDGKGLVRAMESAGVLLPSADTRELENVMTQVFARFGGMSVTELRDIDPAELRDFALEFGDVMLSMPFQLPENYLLIIRTVSLISGMCTSLDPKYNVWDSIEPYAQQLMRDESGGVVKDAAMEVWDTAGTLWRMPGKLDSVLDKVDSGRLEVEMPKLDSLMGRLERTAARVVSAVLFAALLMAGSRVHADNAMLGYLLMGVSVIPLLHTVFGPRTRE